MLTLRERWNSGIYTRGIDTHQEARERRADGIRDLQRKHSAHVLVAQYSGSPPKELRQIAESLRRAQNANPVIRMRWSIFGFRTPFPAPAIHISREDQTI